MRARLVLYLCLAGALSVESCGLSHGQDGISATYGEGVHRYFAGDLAGAKKSLNQSIDAGSQDPRAFYFRGLIEEAMGADGSVDFQTGAKLEALGRRSSPVGSSLTRVQGAVRKKIEKARHDARIMRMKQIQEDKVARASAAQAANKPAGAVVPAAAAGGQSPFADGLRSGTVSVDKTPPPTSEVDAGNFAAPATTTAPASSSSAGGADPFGGVANTPATPEMTAPAADPFGAPATTSAAPAADPFGGSGQAAEPAATTPAADPFGGASSSDPFGSRGDQTGADPFGGEKVKEKSGAPPKTDAKSTPGKSAPKKSDDPFGGEDPFGDS